MLKVSVSDKTIVVLGLGERKRFINIRGNILPPTLVLGEVRHFCCLSLLWKGV